MCVCVLTLNKNVNLLLLFVHFVVVMALMGVCVCVLTLNRECIPSSIVFCSYGLHERVVNCLEVSKNFDMSINNLLDD